MAFKSIESFSFRNLSDEVVETDASSVFIVGENGQGKTNFLDAVYTLCYATSFRASQDKEVVKIGSDYWSIKGQTDDLSEILINWSNNVKTIKLDKKPLHDRKTLIDINPAIVFCHGDMEFSRGEPERKRFFFDQTASLFSSQYIDYLRMYKRTLKARNIALKEKSLDVLDIFDIQLATYGVILRDERAKLVLEFDKCFAPQYEAVSVLGRRVGVEYKPSWKLELSTDEIIKYLNNNRDKELAFGTTMSGPHRDRYIFCDDIGDFSERASTGQLRLMSLTLRIVQAKYFSQMTGKEPLLLLDDVLLELDPEKRKRFMDNLPACNQAFFTFLPGEPWRDYIRNSTIVYWTTNGRLSRE